MFKKYLGLIMVFVLTLSLSVNVVAGNVSAVYGNSVKCNAGETVLIPIYIKDNSGIMGFRINVTYPSQIFESPKITKGNVTKSGSLNDSIKSTTNGTFDVLWSNTENVKSDGTLFTVELKVKDNAVTDKYSIGISYDQDDTFNEKWQDVKLDCSDVEVVVGDYVESETPEEPTMTFFESIIAFFRRLLEFIASWLV